MVCRLWFKAYNILVSSDYAGAKGFCSIHVFMCTNYRSSERTVKRAIMSVAGTSLLVVSPA